MVDMVSSGCHLVVRRLGFALAALALTGLLAACGNVAAQSSSTSRSSSNAQARSDTTHSTGSVRASTALWVDFSKPGHAFGLFSERTSSTSCEAVVAKESGLGGFISPVHLAGYTCGNYPSVDSIATDGSGDVFAFGPALFISHDSGRTFARDAQPGPVLSVSARGKSVWLLEAECKSAASTCQLALQASHDGGHSFTPDASLPTVDISADAVVSGQPPRETWLLRTSTDQGELFPRPATSPGSVSPQMYATSDGGVTWTETTISACRGSMYLDAAVGPQRQLMTICASQPAAGTQVKAALTSANSGATWETAFNCLQDSSSCSASPVNVGYLGFVSFPTTSTAFVGGDRSGLLVTHNDGASWQQVAGVAVNGSDTFTAQFFGAIGYVFGDKGSASQNYIWRTTNLGQSWTSTKVTLRAK